MRRLAAFAFAALALGACSTVSKPSGSADPYLWLEEVEGEQALSWVRERNAKSLQALQADARYAPMEREALAIFQDRNRLPLGAMRNGYVHNFWQDEKNVRGLWRRAPLAGYKAGAPVWETVLDFDALAAAEGKNWVYKGATCLEPEGRLCLVALSDGGKDAVVWREFDVERKAFHDAGFRLNEAKSNVTWKDADTLLVATDWGPGSLTESGYPYIVKEWKRGQAFADAREVIRGQPTDVSVQPFKLRSESGLEALFAVEGDTFFTSTLWRLDGPTPVKLTLPEKASVQELHKDELVFTIEQDWSIGGRSYATGSLLSMPLAEASASAPSIRVIYTPGERESIESVSATRDSLLVSTFRNVKGRLLRFGFDGRAWFESEIPMPPSGTIGLASTASDEATAFLTFSSHLQPSTLYVWEGQGRPREVRAVPAQFNAAGLVVEQLEAKSRDGAKVPYFVIRRADVPLNGSTPTLLYGYGGFQISQTPGYLGSTGKLWLERGGAYVVANIRGGGEFGPAWHQAGLKTNRQVIYDDFAAVAEDLIARKLTSPRRLGIMGGSNGGLLMGVMLTQRPELFNAAVVQVPLLDMLRFHKLLAGASWVAEYGSPDVPEERAFLETISPYQNLRKRANFPVPLIVTSTKDDRVHPGHARKFAARLEELDLPYLYYENIDGGHSAAANQQEAAKRRALEFTYLAQRLMD
jgi:prolyl oligopeptidase